MEEKRKEELTAEAELEGGGHTWFFVCGECHTALLHDEKYCPECGRRIAWRSSKDLRMERSI